ncbi:transcription termination/antitermination NusG family protein [Hyphomicrobium sp.]|uniref:transcription termination/antitermination protein NusG n=1 Tax=Hyphomicrobium sp. TaxID=82 RepID=UPI0025BA4E53|nr:transcription termination/antitermination NusG family protein [Hyphomicrobium sp.]MCC7250963.1 transcriptional activator RfaH [Hyphomicrobium sp.]
MSDGKRWYVVVTQPHGEARAEENLRRQGFSVYLPRYRRTRRHARKTETVTRPLFPRYLFVALDLARDRWRVVQSTFGVQGLITAAGDKPREVPSTVLDAIREREGEDGFVQMCAPALPKGAKIRVLDGIFVDSIGVFECVADRQRVAVLLQLLGREVMALLPSESIEAA